MEHQTRDSFAAGDVVSNRRGGSAMKNVYVALILQGQDKGRAPLKHLLIGPLHSSA